MLVVYTPENLASPGLRVPTRTFLLLIAPSPGPGAATGAQQQCSESLAPSTLSPGSGGLPARIRARTGGWWVRAACIYHLTMLTPPVSTSEAQRKTAHQRSLQ